MTINMMPLGKYIATYQQSHRLSHAVPYKFFYDVEEREQSSCFTKQPRHKNKLRIMRVLPHYCMSCYYHGTHYVSSSLHKLRDMVLLCETTKKTIHCRGRLLSRVKMICHCMRPPVRRLQYSYP